MNILSFLKNNYFEIILLSCIVFLICYGLYRKLTGKTGSWSSNFTYCGLSDTIKNDTLQFGDSKSKDSKGERQCRYVLESIFKRPFLKYRPDFLRNPVTGNEHNLELDCYNPELKLAVEYNGVQHDKYVPYFHRNKEAFLNQKYRDYFKKITCENNNINLIVVPHNIKLEKIEGFLINELKKLKYL